MRKNTLYFAVGLFLASMVASATSINLPQIVTRTIQQAHVNDIRTALSVDNVPRNGAGTSTDVAGNLGSPALRWSSVYANQFCIVYSSGGNSICHAAASAPGSSYTITWPASVPANNNNFLYLTTGGVISLGATSSRISVTGGSLDIVGSSITGGFLGSNIDLPGNIVTENGRGLVVSGSSSPSTSMAIVRGQIHNAAGTCSIISGEGFSITQCGGSGDSTATFTNAFASAPTVSVTVVNGAITCGTIGTPSTTAAHIQCSTATVDIQFIAIGPR